MSCRPVRGRSMTRASSWAQRRRRDRGRGRALDRPLGGGRERGAAVVRRQRLVAEAEQVPHPRAVGVEVRGRRAEAGERAAELLVDLEVRRQRAVGDHAVQDRQQVLVQALRDGPQVRAEGAQRRLLLREVPLHLRRPELVVPRRLGRELRLAAGLGRLGEQRQGVRITLAGTMWEIASFRAVAMATLRMKSERFSGTPLSRTLLFSVVPSSVTGAGASTARRSRRKEYASFGRGAQPVTDPDAPFATESRSGTPDPGHDVPGRRRRPHRRKG